MTSSSRQVQRRHEVTDLKFKRGCSALNCFSTNQGLVYCS